MAQGPAPGTPRYAEATKACLAARLARIEETVVQSGDASDKPDAAPVERAVRRYLRGDANIADALRGITDLKHDDGGNPHWQHEKNLCH